MPPNLCCEDHGQRRPPLFSAAFGNKKRALVRPQN
jgi:hypothetical protein